MRPEGADPYRDDLAAAHHRIGDLTRELGKVQAKNRKLRGGRGLAFVIVAIVGPTLGLLLGFILKDTLERHLIGLPGINWRDMFLGCLMSGGAIGLLRRLARGESEK